MCIPIVVQTNLPSGSGHPRHTLVAPSQEVAKALARGLRRPYFGLPIPAQILQVGLGEAAIVLTEGQTV